MVGWGVESNLREPRGEAGAARLPQSRGGDIASVVRALQREAGNRATVRALPLAAPRRAVMRCQGTCTCGGACRGVRDRDELLKEDNRRLRRAVTARATARVPGRTLARAATLTSPRFLDEPLLEDCFEDNARMGIGASDTATNQPVTKVQQALLDWGAMKGITVDLGPTGPAENGVDGVYGSKTAAAVKFFKATEHLGFEQFGDVGPGTMHRLNDLFPPAGPTPTPPSPTPTSPAPTPTPPAPAQAPCFAPSEVVNTITSSPFGTLMEKIVEDDYIARMGGKPFGDVFLDNPLGPMSYVAFLKRHHPSLNLPLLAVQIGLSGGVLVPDILDTRTISRDDPEFYDVKPNSVDGRPAGRAKLAAIDAFMSANSLPYVRGDSYTPRPSIPLPLTSAALAAALTALGGGAALALILACGLPKVSLEVKRRSRGLLVYRVCVEADFKCYVKVIALELLLAAIVVAIILILTGRLPVPQPVPTPGPPAPSPIPPELPPPNPIPVPVPPVPVPVPALTSAVTTPPDG